jgi:beta-lactamase superfamily II metal-dependent hydrolase
MPKFVGASDKVFLRDLTDRKKKVKQLLWGDWLNVVEEGPDGWAKVKWGREHYWLPRDQIQDERPLEVVFLDVGQGDGCMVVTPEVGAAERVLLIDAGESDNTFRFLKWRFGKLKKAFRFHAAVITHPDADHYLGFRPIFGQKLFSFDRVYLNGIGERKGADRFGPSDPTGRYLTDLVEDDAKARLLYGGAVDHGGMPYPKLINAALTSGRVGAVQMLSTQHGEANGGRRWMPGFSPAANPDLTIEILGPVVEPDAQGRARLRWFGAKPGGGDKDEGKTKNGHSVLMRLCYRGFSLLFGGDLNLSAEDRLLRHYGGLDEQQPRSAGVAAARARLRSDVMKSCHHGSADVTDEFLQAVDPFAFVVSSGDEESHVHPRPDLLGRLGRHGRGDAPLILCTEILRSTRERENVELLTTLRSLDARIEDPATPSDTRDGLRQERAALQQALVRRNVEVYGAITLRTDGSRLALSFRMEKPRSAGGPKRWQTYWFEHDPVAGFQPREKAPLD